MSSNEKQKELNFDMYVLEKQIDILELKLKELEIQFKDLCDKEDSLRHESEDVIYI